MFADAGIKNIATQIQLEIFILLRLLIADQGHPQNLFADTGIEGEIAHPADVVFAGYRCAIRGVILDYCGRSSWARQYHPEFQLGIVFTRGNTHHLGNILQGLNHHSGGVGIGIVIDIYAV